MISAGVLCKFIKVAFSANVRVHNPQLRSFPFRCISTQRLALLKRNVSVNCVAYIHCSQTVKVKFYPDIENQKMHNAMESMPCYKDVAQYPTVEAYKNMILKYGGYSGSKQPTDVFTKFINTTLQYSKDELSLDDERFHELVKSVVHYIPKATDDQLLKILVSLCLWQNETGPGKPMYKKLWNAVDRECVARMKYWIPGFKLLVADYWFHLRLSRITKYNTQMIKDLVESKDVLSVPQLIQLMFHVNLQRDTPQTLLKLLEDKLEHVIKDINLQELCIICLGFFKTKNRIVSKHIVKSILLRLISEVSKGDPFATSGCFKFLRRSMHGDLKDLYVSLLNQAVKQTSKFDVPMAVHLALLSLAINIYIPSVLEAAVDVVMEKKSTMRAKDGMKLLHCFAHFNHQLRPDFDECVRNALEDEEHKNEIETIPRTLIYSLISYAYLGIYPVNLIERALHPEFVQRCIDLDGVEMMNPIAVLNYCVEIECDSYSGPKLDRSFLEILRNEKGNVPRERGHQPFRARLTSLIFRVLCEMCDSSDVYIKHVLPHMFSPDIIVRLNSERKAPLSSVLEPLENCIVKPPRGEVWVCVMVCGAYCFAYNSKHLTGINAMKHRQLLKLGYKVLLVPHHEAETTSQLQKYLKHNLELLKMNNFLDYKHIITM